MIGKGGSVILNICAPDKHVPEIEPSIRTEKERVWYVVLTLLFKTLPELVILHVVLY